MRLTQKAIAALAVPKSKREAIFFDDDIAGFGLRLRAGGSRSWVYQYKLGTKQRRVTLGAFPAVKPEDARATAGKLHAMVRLGRDPASEKAESRSRAAETMDAALRSFLPVQKGRLKPRSYEENERHLLKHAKPLHGLQLAQIDRRTIAGLLTAVGKDSGPAARNRLRASLSGFFVWCLKQGLVDANPVFGTEIATEAGARERVLSDDELRAIWHALEGDQYGAIVKLLLLTAQRRDEIGAVCFSEIDFDKAAVTLPPTRTKNKREHVVPLSAPALAILKAQSRRALADGAPRDLVFGLRGGPFSGWSDSKAMLDARIKERAGSSIAHWTLHDMRRTAATVMADRLGVQPHIIEALLNHIGSRSGVAGVYNRAAYEREKRAALDIWGEHVLAMERRASKIVPLRKV
ncbi:MAG: integrase arm-type DNA-binding domain-containing protein [Xanthobacteraceae bacterium]